MCLDYGLNIQSYERSCDEHLLVQRGPPFLSSGRGSATQGRRGKNVGPPGESSDCGGSGRTGDCPKDRAGDTLAMSV